MPRLHTIGQVLAQEKTARQQANKTGANIKKNLAKEGLFAGLIKTYRPYQDPAGNPAVFQAPPQSTHVQLRIEPDLLRGLTEALAPALDLTAAKEWGNQQASASIELGGETLFEAVPAPYLLFLEHQFAELSTVVDAIPVLDQAEKWEPSTSAGIWQTTEPDITVREQKDEVPSVGHEGNEHHPPQVRWITRSVPTGEYSTVKFSGAIRPDRKEQIQLRVHELKQAIHRAREQANQTEAPAVEIGVKLLSYLFS